jgi:hypothetical protein
MPRPGPADSVVPSPRACHWHHDALSAESESRGGGQRLRLVPPPTAPLRLAGAGLESAGTQRRGPPADSEEFGPGQAENLKLLGPCRDWASSGPGPTWPRRSLFKLSDSVSVGVTCDSRDGDRATAWPTRTRRVGPAGRARAAGPG